MGDMMCCPLSGYDDAPASVFSETVRTARLAHECSECDEPILPGTKYEHARGCWDGSWSTFKTCLSCVEIRNHFACSGGWTYGQVWDQIEENFFPDMRAGGPCMDGLSPAAKGRLFERRLVWLKYWDDDDEEPAAPAPVPP